MKLTNDVKISLVTAACLIALVAVLKNVIMVPAERLSSDVIIYIIIYMGFSMMKPKNLLYGSIAIIAATAAIIGFYAFL